MITGFVEHRGGDVDPHHRPRCDQPGQVSGQRPRTAAHVQQALARP
jgi:hypothetical protein